MPKATLEFQLPEEREEFDQSVRAGELAAAVHDFSEWLRSRWKYGGIDGDALAECQRIREEFHRVLGEWL